MQQEALIINLSREKYFDKFFQRQKRKEFKVMETKVTEAQDQHVYNQFPNKNEIVHEQNIIAILKERTGLSDEEILDSLQRLIEKSKVLAVSGKITNKTFYRKNPFA